MKSWQILAIHSSLYVVLAVFSFGSSAYIFAHPSAFSPKTVTLATIALAVCAVGTWPLFGGCPFTVWENRARTREGLQPYTSSCFNNYASKWFRYALPTHISGYVLTALVLLPLCVRLFSL